MAVLTTQKIEKMGRRRFLKSLGKLGVTGAALANMTPTALAEVTDNPEKDVPRLGWYEHTNPKEIEHGAKPEREAVYYSISREKWKLVESARDAERKVRERFNDNSFTPRVGVRTRMSGEKEIVAHYPTQHGRRGPPVMSYSEFADRVPEKVDGVAGRGSKHETRVEDIPARPKKTPIKHDAYFDYEYRPVPGGCTYRFESGGHCTAGSPAYSDKYNEDVLLTAGHCIDNYDGSLYQNHIEAEDAVMYDSEQYFDDQYGDAGVIRFYSGSPTWKIAEDSPDSYNPHPIVGIVTETRLRDLEGTGTDGDGVGALAKQGATTGRVPADVVEVSDTTFQTNADRDGGDSGGPYDELRPATTSTGYGLFIAGIHEGHPGNQSLTIATQMQYLETRMNLTV